MNGKVYLVKTEQDESESTKKLELMEAPRENYINFVFGV